MGPPWREGGDNNLNKIQGHMTKIAAIPIYGKNFIKSIFSAISVMTLNLGMEHQGLNGYEVYINEDPGLTLTYFTERSNFVPYVFIGKT